VERGLWSAMPDRRLVLVDAVERPRQDAGVREDRFSRPVEVEFFFDLGVPDTYLLAERVDRLFATVLWRAVRGEAGEPDREAVSLRAERLGLPLQWPDDDPPADLEGAHRAAVHAIATERAPAFVLAATRLMWAGGYDLSDPLALAEAAAAAGMDPRETLTASGDSSHDAALDAAARDLRARGAAHAPALVVDGRAFTGARALAEAVAWARSGA
jgi:2-hydroxychromene-2-carboxylate isomerase